jgi:hypothetical protein
MATKLFRIGECSYYGKWRLTVKGNTVQAEGIDFESGEVEESEEFVIRDNVMDLRSVHIYLESVSNYGWADKMMKWVESQFGLEV